MFQGFRKLARVRTKIGYGHIVAILNLERSCAALDARLCRFRSGVEKEL